MIAAKGRANVEALLAVPAEAPEIPVAAKAAFAGMGEHIADLDARLAAVERQLLDQRKDNPVSLRLPQFRGSGRSPRLAWRCR